MVPALAIEDLGLRIGGITIVDGVSFSVRPGEFVVVIGPNGAGKTTLLNLLSGVSRPTSGRVLLADREITHAPPYVRARQGLGRTFQTSTIFAGLTTLENVRIAADAALGTSARLWPLADRSVAPLERARAALADVGLGGREATLAAALSHGEKRKLDLALLLCAQANVVLLDEPTAGMAADDVDDMVALIARIGREHAKTLLMVEHRLDLVLGLADRVAVMHHGALLAIGPPAEIVANETVQSAYLGDPL